MRNNVTAGALRVELSGLADNCAVQGINPREVAVTAEATTEIDFVVLCAATTGSVEVTTTTTGSSLDPEPFAREEFPEDLPAGRVVVDHENGVAAWGHGRRYLAPSFQ